MTRAEEILAALLETQTEPIYVENHGNGGGPMKHCWFCGTAPVFWGKVDFRNHTEDCPWWLAREWKRTRRKKKVAA